MYALFSKWPADTLAPTVQLAQVKAKTNESKFTLLDGGNGQELNFTIDESQGVVTVKLPATQPSKTLVAWVIKMENIEAV